MALIGLIKKNDELKLSVEIDQRNSATSHHSATHLMHAALKSVLGNHVHQKGSLLDANKLRFDFSHSKAVSKEDNGILEDATCKKLIPLNTRI